jgi:hypothetical protein
MKPFQFVLLLTAGSFMLLPAEVSASIRWVEDLAKLEQQHISEPRPTVLYFQSGRAAQEEIVEIYWDRPEVIKLSQEFHMGKLNVKDPSVQQLAMQHQVFRVPCVVMFFPNGEIAKRLGSDDLTHRNLVRSLSKVALKANQQLGRVSPRDYMIKLGLTNIDLDLLQRVSYIEDVGKYGDGKADYRGRNVYVVGVGKDDIGRVIAFTEIQSRGGKFFEAKYDPEATKQLQPYLDSNPPVLPIHLEGNAIVAGADTLDAGFGRANQQPLLFPKE